MRLKEAALTGAESPVWVQPGLPPWGPHVRFRRVQTLVRRAVRWFDFAQRAALRAVAPHLQASEQQNLELQNRLTREARHRLDQQVERAVPNYRERWA